jgi:hypothetical protein
VTTLTATSKRVAPSARAPSRSERGTARIASSDSEDTVGRHMTPTASPAEVTLKKSNTSSGAPKSPVTAPATQRSAGVMVTRAKNP